MTALETIHEVLRAIDREVDEHEVLALVDEARRLAQLHPECRLVWEAWYR